jgi:hypothetical protein
VDAPDPLEVLPPDDEDSSVGSLVSAGLIVSGGNSVKQPSTEKGASHSKQRDVISFRRAMRHRVEVAKSSAKVPSEL